MSPRAIRRARERQAVKLARKGAGPEVTRTGIGGRTFAELHTEIEEAEARTDLAWAASRADAQAKGLPVCDADWINGGPLAASASGDHAGGNSACNASPLNSEAEPWTRLVFSSAGVASEVAEWPSLPASSSPVRPSAAHDRRTILDSAAATPPVSDAKLAAHRAAINKANAQHSTGPTSAEGKAKCSLNAVKTGLTGQTVLLPTDDVALYQQHLADHAAKWNPVGPFEAALLQSIADAAWRLQRIPALEYAIYSVGYHECVAPVPEGEPLPDRSLIDLHTFTKHEKNLRNLHLQESRLRRHQEKDRQALEALQSARIAGQNAHLEASQDIQLEAAAQLYTAAKNAARPWTPFDDGFVFSINEIECYLRRCSLDKAASQPSPIGGKQRPTDQQAA